YGHWHEQVRVRITASLSPGRLIGFSESTQSVAQTYAIEQDDSSNLSGWSHGISGSASATGLPVSPFAGIERGYTGRAWSSGQYSDLQGAGVFDGMHRYQRDLSIRIEVTRLPPTGDDGSVRSVIEHTRRRVP